jgi:tripartite-type tricarboxylate transporter receptor subunit TctC
MAAGIDMLHVPLAGSNEVLAAVVANQVQVSFSTPGPAKQFITSGRVKLLATVPPKRDPSNPDTPTLAEALPGFEPIADWFGFFGPAKLPPAIVNVINAEVVKAVNAPDNRTRFTNASLLVVGSTPEEFAETMKREYPVYAKIVKLANVPMQ